MSKQVLRYLLSSKSAGVRNILSEGISGYKRRVDELLKEAKHEAEADEDEERDEEEAIAAFKTLAIAKVRTLLPRDNKFTDDQVQAFIGFHLLTRAKPTR